MIKLYLDIDGVLIGKNQRLPNGIENFIKFILQEFDCYWLTTHCKGDIKTVIKYLGEFYPESFEKYWRKIKTSNWDVLKTEAIEFTSDFVWLDDQPLRSEMIHLSKHDSIQNLIIVDLQKDNEISRIEKLLKDKLELRLPSNWQIIDKEPYEAAKVLAEIFELESPDPNYENELHREMCSTHVLYGCQLRAVGYCRDDINEILYETNLPGNPYAVVHLTWNKENSPKFPHTVLSTSFEDFRKKESSRKIHDK